MSAPRKYFGTDGIRGRVGDEPVTPHTILKLGWAAGRVLADGGDKPGMIVIGKDTRISGYLLESALEAGLSAAGVDISLIGPLPTPGIAYLTRTSRANAGIVISASHNDFKDNGIKFFTPGGSKISDETEQAIEAMMERAMTTVPPGRLGKASRFPGANGRYIEFCKSTIADRESLHGMRLVIDCAHGAAYHVGPQLLHELGVEVIAIGNQPNGLNINQDCGSTDLTALSTEVRAQGAAAGIALDGDGDRVLMVDGAGRELNGDQLLYLMAKARLDRGARGAGGVVGTRLSNLGLEQGLAALGIPFARTDVGDRLVIAELKRHGWVLGGEPSGHIICLDKNTTGDGLIAALEVLHVMARSGRSLAKLAAEMPYYPQVTINVELAGPRDRAAQVLSCDKVRRLVQEARGALGEDGRVVLRSSGTQPLIRVMVEGDDQARVQSIAGGIADAVRSATGASAAGGPSSAAGDH